MAWRFADLPISTKFMVTLGIPVLGMVLLIGKQVDSNLKRSTVFSYITEESANIALYSDVLHELQKERAYALAYLQGRPINELKLKAQFMNTDEAVNALQQPSFTREYPVESTRTFNGLDLLRDQVLMRSMEPMTVFRTYRSMGQAMVDELWRVGKLALDPFTKERLYAHTRLLNAKEALGEVRDLLNMDAGNDGQSALDLAELSGRVAQYETNMLLFERDASPEVLGSYRNIFQGSDVNFMRSVIGTVKERRMVDRALVNTPYWWDISLGTVDKLKEVEDRSMALITEANVANSRDARIRLLVVIAALIGVVGAVMIMGFVIMRGVRSTVDEVTHATQALAVGDVSAEVPVTSNDEVGRMALAFNSMTANIRSLANSAESIGKGDYDTAVIVRSEHDVLGMALSRMKENLAAARLRDTEQTLALQTEKAKLEQANERIHILIKEMHHRVKNNLQVIASLLRLQEGTIGDERLQHAFEQSRSRVTSMALIHEKLYKGDELARVEVAQYLAELFAELVRVNDVDERIRYTTDLDPGLTFDLDTMVPLGLLFNELITNSFKHAFKGRASGLVTLSLHRSDERTFDLVYGDDGVGMSPEKLQANDATLGVTLIESLVEQLNGRMSVNLEGPGTQYHIRFRSR